MASCCWRFRDAPGARDGGRRPVWSDALDTVHAAVLDFLRLLRS
jgi:hypothetical protein